MKLKNKKTGEIISSKELFTEEYIKDLFSKDVDYFLSKLEKLKEYWEEYEEPKSFWYIRCSGEVYEDESDASTEHEEKHKAIGNYFETKEEAEKAVEKIKAWKRLKDKCNFRFTGIEQDERGMLKGVKVSYDRKNVTFSEKERVIKGLMLLFGGEE